MICNFPFFPQLLPCTLFSLKFTASFSVVIVTHNLETQAVQSIQCYCMHASSADRLLLDYQLMSFSPEKTISPALGFIWLLAGSHLWLRAHELPPSTLACLLVLSSSNPHLVMMVRLYMFICSYIMGGAFSQQTSCWSNSFNLSTPSIVSVMIPEPLGTGVLL